AWPEAECVLQATRHDAVNDANVDDVREVVARCRLARRETDRARISADHGGDARRIHFLDLGIAPVRRRLGIAVHRVNLCTVQGFEAAGGIDLLDRKLRAEAALLARIG